MSIPRFLSVWIAALLAPTAVILGTTTSAHAQVGTVKPLAFPKVRGMRYCEVFLVKPDGIFMYNTTGLNDCPAGQWNALDTEKLKTQYGAREVFKNGPHFWVSDTLTLDLGETLDFGGMKARWVGTLPVALMEGKSGGAGVAEPYKVFHPEKSGKFSYLKGKEVYELVGPDGTAYVMQAGSDLVDKTLNVQTLAKLGEKLKVAPGWKYRVRKLDRDLVFELPKGTPVDAVSDDLRNIYNRVPGTQK